MYGVEHTRMVLAFIVLIPLVGAVLPAALERLFRFDGARVAAALTVLTLAAVLAQSSAALEGTQLVQFWPWIPALGLNIAFRLDGYSFLFALLILGIGLLVIVYARYYLAAGEQKARFYGLLLLFMGAMLGLVLSENLLLLVVFWELTSLSSFLLIGFWRHEQQARQGARLALVVTGVGGLALLAGVLMLGEIVGSFELSTVLASASQVQAHPHYLTVLVLVLIGAFTKSAQFPFHFWLPHAMAAPTPVSAFLHSATMVKAGIFLIGRLFPVLAGTQEWFFIVSGTGLATLLLASYIAVFRHDLKGLLAYSTASHLGLITLLFGLGSALGAVAAVFHIINHAVFKASLFMSAGIIDHETGTRDMRRLSGLARFMPQTAALATVAAGAMAGVPLLNGFLSKEMFFAETLQLGWLGAYYWAPPAAATLAGIFTVAYSARFVHDVFFGPPPSGLPRTPHEPPVWMLLPVAVLVATCLLVGLVPELTVRPLLDHAVRGVLQQVPPEYSIKLWHGFNLPLAMSLVALVGGAILYAARRFYFNLHGYSPSELTGKALAESSIDSLLRLARKGLPLIENNSLQRYLFLLILCTVALGWWGMKGTPLTGDAALTPADPLAIATAAILVLAATATAVFHRQRLQALISLAVVGLIVALTFVRFSAPDLALTQLLVEIVTVVLLLLALFFMPQESPGESTRFRRVRDVLIALIAGAGAAGLTWATLTRGFSSISGFYLENAKPEGGGYNVVNVILVDFRGFDTLGEIAVLGIATLASIAMLSGLHARAPHLDWQGRPWSTDRHPMMLRVIARPLLPLALLVAAYLFLRGHNAPGGGFIAGLVAATAIIVQYIAYGAASTHARMRAGYVRLIGLGLLLAAFTGITSMFFRMPFLTSAFGYVRWPLIGQFELASALAFDLGVFLVVVGTVLGTLSTLGRVVTPEPGSAR